MFSASAGALTCEMLDENFRQALSDSINSFDLIGVRDDNTYNLVKQLGFEKDVTITPDPTFAMEIDYSYVENFFRQKKLEIKDSTIAVYLSESVPLRQKIIKYYQQKGLPVAVLGYGPRGHDCSLPMMTPLEWAGIHKYFSLEITDRFHGSIFSLKNLRPVVAIDLDKRKYTENGLSKTYSLMKLFDMHQTNHINVDRCKNFDEIVAVTDEALKTFNSELISQRLDGLRSKYFEFLGKTGKLIDLE